MIKKLLRMESSGRKKTFFIVLLLSLLWMGFTGGFAADNGTDALEQVLLSYFNPNSEIYKLLKNHKWKEAIEVLNRDYKLTNADHNLKYFLVYCHAKLAAAAFEEKKYREAIKHLENCIEHVNDRPEFYQSLGFCHFSLAQYPEAEDAYSQVIRLKPDHFIAHRMLGEICYLTNRLEKALEHWQEALKIKPDDSYTKERVHQLKTYKKVSDNFETEVDMMFSVSFDGTSNPQLRELVLDMLEEISRRIGQEVNLYPTRQVPVILMTNREFFDITGSPQWAGGVYEGHIKVPVDKYKPGLLKIVLTHEYVHAVIFDRLSYRCPWWLNEGLAQYLSRDGQGNQKKLQMAAKFIREGTVPTLEDLSDWLKGQDTHRVQIAYALALSAVQFFIDNYGLPEVQYVLELMSGGEEVGAIIKQITGYSFSEFQANWKEFCAQ
jgi:tetratricopeptide (TPR) repeat protein